TFFSKLIVIILVLLGVFQLAEYQLCQGVNQLMWAKIGVASITLLPVLGLHLMTILTKKSKWVYVGYGLGIVIISMIIFVPSVSLNVAYTGKYVAIQTLNNMYD